MNREDYMREIAAAGRELFSRAEELSAAANPVALLKASISREWKWWVPSAAVAGFVLARLLRAQGPGGGKSSPSSSGAAYWVPVVAKLVPALATQIVPLILSLRSRREP